MKIKILYIIMLVFCIGGNAYSSDLNNIEKLLNSGRAEEKKMAMGLLCSIINDESISNEERLAAIRFSASKGAHECSDVIIKYIDKDWVRIKSAMSFEQSYPNVQALMSIGEKAVPKLIEGIRAENDGFRLRLMGYTLGRIMKREAALADLDKLLDSDISETEKGHVKSARAEVAKWSDYPWDTKK